MLAAADEFLGPIPDTSWVHPAGGLYVWLAVPPRVETGPSGSLFAAAVDEGVLYVPGEYFFPGAGLGVAKNLIRLSFGVQSAENVRAGMAALARALARVLETA
jgi:2-aminoadipate transaminase